MPPSPASHAESKPIPPEALARDGSLLVVTWNVHEGRGDVAALLKSLRPADVVLLLQEATRNTLPALARSLNLHASYVPSMPNGKDDDRGNAILSTLPIEDIVPLELPWVYQRRVVVVGTVAGLRFASVHLDNRPARKKQAEWLAAQLKMFAADGAPLLVGGDLNTWFGAEEDTVRAIDAVAPRVECGDRPTFRFGRRLDHLFTTAPRSWLQRCEVLRDTFGSDHHPIALRLLR